MAGEVYVPTDRELAEHPADYTRRNVALLARDYFGRKAAGYTLSIDTKDLGVIEVAMPAAKPEPAAATAKPEPAPASSQPGLPPGRVDRELRQAVVEHREQWADTYGVGDRARLVRSDNLDGFVIRPDGELVRGQQHTSDEEQARLRALLTTADGMTRQQQHAAYGREAAEHASATAQRKLAEHARVDEALRGAAEGRDLNWEQLRNAAGRPRPVTR